MTEENNQFNQISGIYFDETLPIEERVEDLLSKLTLEEKISLLTRQTGFSTKPIERLGIPEFGMTDGPHGCGPHSSFGNKNTYFPSAICLAATWNTDLAYEFGQALGEETRAVGRHCILAPGINIQRTPLCGRNFEYYTEDPFLNSKIVVPMIKGVQSRRIAACVKHFVCNNTEIRRRFSNSIVDERTLEEIYYPGFKAAVGEGNAWMIMGSYNKVNGRYVYEQKNLLTDKLRNEWGFSGFVVSDWLATHSVKSPADCIKAGFTLEMPELFVYEPTMVMDAYNRGEFKIEELDENIRRLLRVFFNVGLFDSDDKIPNGSRNTEEHLKIAQKIIEEGSVLLKNEKNILPLHADKIKKICITGPLADYWPKMSSIGGSSAVNPPNHWTVLKTFKENLKDKVEFVKNPEDADAVILVTGKTQWFYGDSEGMDKDRLSLSEKRIKEIKKIAGKNPNVIVVIYNGGPYSAEDWIENVKALLTVWQPHQMAGQAIYNLLFGIVNPSGKLTTTFPKKLSDSPAHKNSDTYPRFKYSYFDMFKHEVLYVHPKRAHKSKSIDIYYEEGIYVGYRHFDRENIKPQFPFGFGLSYTEFEYSNLRVNKTEFNQQDTLEPLIISLDVKNTGDLAGSEIVQVYISDLECSVDRPVKELKGFAKPSIKPGEQVTVNINIDIKNLAFYDVNLHQWKLEPGEFNIMVGSSSADIKLEKKISVL